MAFKERGTDSFFGMFHNLDGRGNYDVVTCKRCTGKEAILRIVDRIPDGLYCVAKRSKWEQSLPGVGHVAAMSHVAVGDSSGAKAAAGRANNGLVNTAVAAGAVCLTVASGGTALAVVGAAAAGGAAGSVAGHATQAAWEEVAYSQRDVRKVGKEAQSKSAWQVAIEALVGGIVGGVGGFICVAAGEAAAKAVAPNSVGQELLMQGGLYPASRKEVAQLEFAEGTESCTAASSDSAHILTSSRGVAA